MYENRKQGRPAGITILAILLTLMSIFTIMGYSNFLTYSIIILTILELLIVFGFWKLKKWGWILGEGYFILILITFFTIFLIANDSPPTVENQMVAAFIILPILFVVGIIVYIYAKWDYFIN